MNTGLQVIRGGLTTQLQDIGRKGFAHLGITEAGPADYPAYYLANKLLGNPLICSQLELANGGLVMRANLETSIAVTGAVTELAVNGKQQPLWQSIKLFPGDEISIGSPTKGVFNYLAIRGGFQVAPILSSVATSPREGLGGLDGKGKRLRVGQLLPAFPSRQEVALTMLKANVPLYGNRKPIVLRLIPGSQYQDFTRAQKRTLFARQYQVDKNSNKMGYRLLASEKTTAIFPAISSEAISYGAVQVPNSNEMIVMLNERQTIGGYPKLGTLYPPDCWALAQARVGSKVSIELMRLSVAQRRYRKEIHQLENAKLHDISSGVVA